MWAQIAVGIATGLLTGAGTAWFSFAVFRAQRTWDLKSSAYKELLESLQDMKAANDELYDAELHMRTLPEKREIDLVTRWQNGKVIAYRFADIGEFNISAEIEVVMEEFRQRVDNRPIMNSMFEELDYDAVAISNALSRAKAIAMKDTGRSHFGRAPSWLLKIVAIAGNKIVSK